MNDNKRYYIVQNDEQKGPMTWDELRSFSYGGRNTRVWTEGFSDWVSVSGMEDLTNKMRPSTAGGPVIISNEMPTTASILESLTYDTTSIGNNAYGSISSGEVRSQKPLLITPLNVPQRSASYPVSDDPVIAAGHQYANAGIRFCVEMFNLFVVFTITSQVATNYPFIGTLLVNAVYGAVCYYFFSGTLGHLIFQVKVVSETTGEDFKNPLKGALREMVKSFLKWFVLPVIWLLWDPKTQNVYDKIFQTVVVKKIKSAI
jgi:hypothetical protein